jgi:hypothetical protein
MPSMTSTRTRSSPSEIPRVGPDEDPTAALALLVEHGVLIIDKAVSAERIGRIEREFDPWFRAAHCGTGPFLGRQTRRFAGLLAKSPSVADLAIHPLALELVERVLRGPDPDRPRCDSIELNLTQAVGIQPGEPPQVLHRDDQTWPIPHDIEAMANVMWPLDDFTEENGATMVVPGSHRWDRDRWAKPREIMAATAARGSAIVWLGSLLHGGGANRSAQIRRGAVMSYRLGWLAGSERLLLSTPPDVVRRLPERLQRLVGYQLHRPNLGWVEGRDPLLWLNGEVGALAPVDDNLTPGQERVMNRIRALQAREAA